MRRIYTSLLVIIVSIITACKKDGNNNTTDPNNVPGLPPATQSGANTFGCLVNGVPWVPAGSNGTPNLSIDYDPRLNNGYFSIQAYNASAFGISYFIVGIRDSINMFINNQRIVVGPTNLGAILFSDANYCRRYSDDLNTYSKGAIVINNIDRQKRIIAGTFEAILFTVNCADTIKITKGRFDFKF
jgi:hypothetical protein